jgi:tRNA-specific 2-thiouridylase
LKKAIIAMSGGVDSSVAAYLMKEQGYECMGITMKLFHNEDVGLTREHTCCSLDDIEDARAVANRLDMPYHVFNFADKFKEKVIEPFICAYEHGMTPNPCIECNRYLKFDKLFQRAKELDYDYVVTGHYAISYYDEAKGRYMLKKAVDDTKDQSYVLYSLTQDQLAHIQFPLGTMTKMEAREVAEKNGFVNARKHDSQDICFVTNGKYAEFIEGFTGKAYPEGNFVNSRGEVLGTHKGIIRYTIGQRKGLGLALKEPMYVMDVDTDKNQVMLGRNDELFSRELYANDINLISVERIEEPMRVKAKVRYRAKEDWATVTQTSDDTIHVVFDNPQRAITKGQAVVLYDGDSVVGGGTVIKVDK